MSHHRAETAKEQHAGNNTDTTTAAEKKTKEETGKVELTDAQKEIIKGYDTDTKELIDTLSSSVWSVSEGRYTLKFADDSYVETVNGTPTVHSYAISRVEKTSDGYGGSLYTIVFETDAGTHIVTYTDGSGAAVNSDSKTPGENTISTLTSSTMFAQKNTAYERAEAVTNITVKGMNSEVTKLFGGDEKAVITALSKWCAVHYPSVTEATWQKVVNLDYENGVITTDFKLKEEGTLPHDFTTGKWRVHLIYPGERYGLDGCLTYELNAYSGVPAAAHRASYPLVEFYDTSQDAARFPGGQFVSRYYMTDLLEDDSIAVSLDTMLKNGNQFSLDGGIPAWTVEGDDLAKVNDFLKKSCMEFCGSLPGDEKGEDGYSLMGEAKDATASRDGLNGNQTRTLEETVAECMEAATALANGDAL